MNRGRGRGRGGFGRGFGGYAKQEPFELFPETTLPDRNAIPIENDLVIKQFRFENYWKSSPFFLGDGASKDDNESLHIERYSDMGKAKNKSRRESFLSYLILRPDNFPKELIGDSRKDRPVKKARWNWNADLKKLDSFIEEEKKKDGEDATKEKEEDEEVEDEAEEDEAEYSDDGDYNQAEYVDDDEDDFNDVEEGDDEPTY